MKKLRLIFGTIILGTVVAAASLSHNPTMSAGADPVPVCPPDGCAN
jgi:hypothetical protein